ncbi:MAG: HAMP domain-containing histidine kinase [Propionibacteriaceae bacterium]|nr:HAMP domain-containing histidine kinase [Propionibacteriaceae bacterium]
MSEHVPVPAGQLPESAASATSALRGSFRRRLLVSFAILFLIGTVVTGSVAYAIEWTRIDDQIDESLLHDYDRFLSFAALKPDGTPDETLENQPVFTSTRDFALRLIDQSVNSADECKMAIGPDPSDPGIPALTTNADHSGSGTPALTIVPDPEDSTSIITDDLGSGALIDPWAKRGALCANVLADEELAQVLADYPMDGPIEIKRLVTAEGSYAYMVIAVKMTGDTTIGRLIAVSDREALLQEAFKGYVLIYLPVGVGATALLVLFAWILSGQILRPLRVLAETTKRITESDDLSLRVPVYADDEVGELSSSFNTMLDSLDQAFASERRLLDDVGHELRTPLTIIQGNIELTDPDDPKEFASTKALVLDEVDRMRRLVDSLVTLAQADNPDFVQLEPTELAPLVDEVLDKARALGERRWQMSDRMEVPVLADSQRLTQALLELAKNAVKYSDPGSAISFGVTVDADGAHISVRDHGKGIPAAMREKIFERFTRAEGQRRLDGAGLGLAIVERIVAAHRGKIEVESAVGVGSVFTVTLPVLASDDNDNFSL